MKINNVIRCVSESTCTRDLIERVQYLEDIIIDQMILEGYSEKEIYDQILISKGAIVSRREWWNIHQQVDASDAPECDLVTDSEAFLELVDKFHEVRMQQCMSFELEGE